MHKASAISILLIAGAISAGLSGCRYSHGSHDRDNSSASDGGSDSGAIHISKMGGDIHVGDVGSYAKVKSMGGTIAIDHATGPIDASTMGGGISIGHASGAIKASTMGGDITARMVGDSSSERDVELTSHGGTITLTVPKDFPMDVRIVLAYTKNAPRTYEIIDHIGLQQQESPDWDNSLGSPRKYIRAAGRVGSGLNHVVIKTTNGDVILKQE